ncbi:T9SS type A sorting domain-containing protein, partial [Bacteroidales bacterium OttesenSCG-928-I14]|nr:T9SS type A sorting domain-containing protein [Bacteroidales bacterium OttesenSCG-928-I14]
GISADLVSIVQGTGKTIDISNSSLIGLRDGVVISIANCATYDMENIYVKGAFRFTAPTSCNKSIKKVTSSSVTNTTKNNQLHIGELEMPGNTLDISGYVEADKVIANPELLGGTIKLTAGATLQINEELITRGTPCNYVLISGASSTNKGILKYSACAPELYYTEMENIIGDVSGVSSTCTAEEDGFNGKLIVYGKATLADGNVNVEFRNPITTGEFALPEKRIACAPYPLTFPVGHTVISYQWYKDDIAIPDELGGNTASVEINEDGTYTLYADYGELCTSRISQVVKIDNKHVWTALGAENDWNDEANWDIITIPDICSHVIIPGGLDHYPILKPEHVDGGGNTVGSPKCHTIEFRFGGEVKNTHELTYTLAIVDLTVNGNQWYMLSAPLRNMYVGDIYHTDPAPLKDGYLMEPMYFNQNNPENGRRYGDWSGKFNTSDIEFLPGQGFALWANDIDADYDEQIPVTFTFPKYDPFYYYYNYHGGIEGQSKNLSRVHNGRFIYEPVIDVSKNVLLESSPATKDGDLVFVGNPFMAHLDFDKFAARNSTNIYDEYKLAYGLSADGIMSSFKTYKKINGSYYTTDNADSNLTGLIPPMQSFLVITKVANPQIKANIEETVVAVSGKLPNLKSGLVTYEETPKALEIKLDKSGEYTKTLLLHFNGASNDYLPQEDSYKVFSPYADTPLVVYTKSKDGVALDINSIGNFDEPVSLCISTVQTGEMTISFSGYENFRKHAEIFLKDLLTGTLINISETNKYTFVKNTEEQYIEDRFQLLFTPKDVNSINRIDEPSFVKVYNDLRGNVQIVSDDIITSVIVLDVQGSVIKNITNLNSSTVNMSAYDMSIVNSGVYLLQVVSKGVKSTHKVIIK